MRLTLTKSMRLSRTWQIKFHLLHIKATTFAVKSLSSQWLSENLFPNFFATRQVTTDGIIWCSWQENTLSQIQIEYLPHKVPSKNHIYYPYCGLKTWLTNNLRIEFKLNILWSMNWLKINEKPKVVLKDRDTRRKIIRKAK